jgi:hypothetical protein
MADAQALQSAGTAPRWSLLLALAYLVHLGEEWWGGPGFSAWTRSALGVEIGPARFLVINAIAWPLFTLAVVAAVRSARFCWAATSFAALVVLNGCLHLLATVGLGSYSPGTVSGVLLYLPLGGRVLLETSRRLARPVFARGVAIGIAVHALVALLAFF